MCRWGCPTTDTTYQCKWCGTRYCRACLRGDFTGLMPESSRCRTCNQKKCQGPRVEYVEPRNPSPDGKGRGKSGRSIKSSKSSKSAKSKRSTKSGRKSGKKKKK